MVLFIYFNSVNAWLSTFLYVTLYYYFFSFNAVRQFMALSVLLVAFTFAKRQYWFPFLILLLLAITFHTTSIVWIAMLYVYYGGTKIRTIVVLNTVVILVFFLFESFLSLVTRIIPRYSYYTYSPVMEESGGIRTFIVYAFRFLVALLFRYIRKI